jgi:hypothetical protein
VLLDEAVRFLARSGIDKRKIRSSFDAAIKRRVRTRNLPEFDFVTRSYEALGGVLSTWFDTPEFLNPDGSPATLTLRKGRGSLDHLLKAAKVKVDFETAKRLLELSPSVTITHEAISANRRVFVVPALDLIRAALVIPRYLETLESNAQARRSNTVKLLERQCSASKINPTKVAALLRNIKEQGGSFVDSIDGQIEAAKQKPRKKQLDSELGLLVFAWTTQPRTGAKRL